MENAALASLAGLAPAYLEARWPDDIAAIEAIVTRATELRQRERHDLAVEIANQVGKMLGG